jgi:hypothetical protein
MLQTFKIYCTNFTILKYEWYIMLRMCLLFMNVLYGVHFFLKMYEVHLIEVGIIRVLSSVQ